LAAGIPVKIIKQKQTVNNSLNSFTWYGKIKGQPGSFVILTNVNTAVSGYIRDKDNKIYRIQYKGNNIHQISAINSLFIRPDKVLQPLPFTGSSGTPIQESGASNCCDTTGEIDVMVVYTKDAKDSARGIDGINSTIALCIDISNTCYENSHINQKIFLVHTSEVDYSEASENGDTYLSNLIDPRDGYMDNVHDLRNTYKADIVVLFVGFMTYEGISKIMTHRSVSFEDSAFCVVKYDHSYDHRVFTHEIGHIMGAGHQCTASNVYGLYEYSRGYMGINFNTIMSNDNHFGRIEYFSNPNVSFPGPGGLATGISSADCTTDNALTLNNTRNIVSQFRCRDGLECSSPQCNWIGSFWFWLILLLVLAILFFLFWYFFRRNR
jgi:peptidyl-Asp metalloendopeptidase